MQQHHDITTNRPLINNIKHKPTTPKRRDPVLAAVLHGAVYLASRADQNEVKSDVARPR